MISLLACPRDRSDLHTQGEHLCCERGHRYPIVDGVPVFLLSEKQQTIGLAVESLRAAENGTGSPLYLDTIGVSEQERRGIEHDWNTGGCGVDPAISYLVGATSGSAYRDQIGRLESYPIPDIPIPCAASKMLLDVGCNWGRWSISAARKGWKVIGIDPSLGAIMAARRAFSGLGLNIEFVCGDARFLPFKPDVFDGVFSYSVIQHFAEEDAERCVAEFGRVLGRQGVAKIQMAHSGGLRGIYIRTRSDYMTSGTFRVRYWSLKSMRSLFERRIGATSIRAEAFGGLGLLAEDLKFASFKAKAMMLISELLKRTATVLPSLVRVADSVYIEATKRA